MQFHTKFQYKKYVKNGYCYSNYLCAKPGNFVTLITTQAGNHLLIISANRVLQEGSEEMLTVVSTSPTILKTTRAVNRNAQVPQGASITERAYCSNTKPINLHEYLSELMLASLLKLFFQARVRSHASFFTWARLFLPHKVHSSRSITICSGRGVSPAVVLLGSHHKRRPARKKTGVTLRAMTMFQWLRFAL